MMVLSAELISVKISSALNNSESDIPKAFAILSKVDIKIISIVQSYIIKYGCATFELDQPTGLKIIKKIQYFEGEQVAQAATINEYFIPINGGVDDGSIQFTDSFNIESTPKTDNFHKKNYFG